jgi:peptide/nickel transport system permease protein
MLIAGTVGVGLGILAAVRHATAVDQLTMVGAVVGVSMPIFWLGLMLMLLFGVVLGWLPVSGRLDPGVAVERVTGLVILDALVAGDLAAAGDALAHLVLPALALATIPMAVIARMTRSCVLEALGQDYVRTARAKGLAEHAVVLRHAVRNALLPTVTVLGLQFGALLGGAIITETIFGWPGVGRWLLLAVQARDFRAVQGGVLLVAAVFAVLNLIVDLLYSVLDPRVRYE